METARSTHAVSATLGAEREVVPGSQFPVERDKSQPRIEVEVEPFGPTSEELAEIGERVIADARVRKVIGRSKARLLYVEAIDDDDKSAKPRPPRRFRATLYDDENHRAILVDGSLRDRRRAEVTESALPPHPSDAEYAAALTTVRRDAAFAAAIGQRQLEPYQPVPALALNELPDGRIERRIAVGLLPRGRDAAHRDRRRRRRAPARDPLRGRLPPNVRPLNLGLCGVPHDANQTTAAKGTAGQVWVTITGGGQTLWRFLAVRPAAPRAARTVPASSCGTSTTRARGCCIARTCRS